MLNNVDENGRVLIAESVDYLIEFYNARKEQGPAIEKILAYSAR